MSAEKCGPIKAVYLGTIKFDDPEVPDLVLSEKATFLLKKIRQKDPDWSPNTVKSLYNKAYKMGLFDEQD